MDMLVEHPGRILIVAAFYVFAGLLSGKRGDGVWGRAARPCYFVALLWAALAIWEYIVTREGANSRVDLMILYPLLLVVSVVAPILSFRRARATNSSSWRTDCS